MTYKSVAIVFLSSLFKAGLALEVLACMLFRDCGLWLVRRAHWLVGDGLRQIQRLEEAQ